jgi:hypothetical protein
VLALLGFEFKKGLPTPELRLDFLIFPEGVPDQKSSDENEEKSEENHGERNC